MVLNRSETRLLAAAALIAAAVVAVGVAIHAATGALGTATPPFVMAWGPRADGVALAVALTAAAALPYLAPRLLAAPRHPAAFAACVLALTLAVGLAINAARAGTHGWTQVFDLGPRGSFEAKNEVLAGLPALSYGVHFFLDRYAELVPSQPVGLAGHPPGLPLLMHLTGIDTAGRLAALCAGATAAVAPATYALGRSVLADERGARRAALLACGSPALLLFGISSTDAVFALAGTLTAALLCAARPARRAAGFACLALAALLSWALLAIGAWATLVAWQRRGPRAAVGLAAGCAVAVLATQAVLAGVDGYDPVGTLRATSHVYHSGIARSRPYAFWLFGSPIAFALIAGLPVLAGWLVAALRRVPAALALVAVVGVAAVLGFTKAETERIWLPFVPLACVAAAGTVPDRRLRVVLGLLVAQVLAIQLLFATVW